MFDAPEFIEESIQQLKATIDDVAIIACSGGVDSTVAAVIANKAVGDLLHCVYVDTGFMRKNETEEIEAMLAEQGINLITVKAADRYFEALKGVTEPEQKRKVIGELFIRIFEDEQKKCGAKYLVQGTIAPDWIESGGGVRDTIKSHHNVGGLPEDMTLEVVEPLRELYKDEVRELARELDIIVAERQPFPGPGLAVRTLGELTPERVEVVREACAIVEEEFEAGAEAGEMELPWQYFAALLPVRSVGVHGDVRAMERQSLFVQYGAWMECLQDTRRFHITSCRRSVLESPTRSRVLSTELSTTLPTNHQVRSSGSKGSVIFLPVLHRLNHFDFLTAFEKRIPMPKAGCNSKRKKEAEQNAENCFRNHGFTLLWLGAKLRRLWGSNPRPWD